MIQREKCFFALACQSASIQQKMRSSMLFMLVIISALSLHGEVTKYTVRSSGGDYAGTLAGLQSAVGDCRALDTDDPCVIEIEAGLTLSNGTSCFLTLAAQSAGTKLIVIRSSKLSELPEGTRVTAADASKMAKIDNACSASPGVIIVPPETTGVLGTAVASRYLIQGLELHYSGEGRNAGGAMNIGLYTDGATKARALWQSPHAIIVDRVWTHGNDTETWITASSTHANQNGVRVDGRNITVKNSLINHNNMDGVDHGGGESHGIAASNGPGPFYVLNNKATGAIPSLIGGEWAWIPGLVATGGFFYGNEFTQEPFAIHWLEWDTTDTLKTDLPCISGSFFEQKVSPFTKWKCVDEEWEETSDSRVNRGWSKNAFEWKNIRLTRAEGNYMHDYPSVGDQSQWGFCMLTNNVDAQEGAYYARTENAVFQFNLCKKVGSGPTGSWGGSTSIYKHSNDITIRHNVIADVNHPATNPVQGVSGNLLSTPAGRQFAFTGIQRGLSIRNNTSLYAQTFGGAGLVMNDSDSYGDTQFDFRDNIYGWASLGQMGDNTAQESCTFFSGLLAPGSYWDHFGLIDTNSRGSTAFTNLYTASNCPANVSRAADIAAVKFVDADNGDYRLCTDTDEPETGCTASPWATASSTGGPLGADAEQVDRMTAGAKAGTYDAGLFSMRIVGVVENDLRYVPYHPQGNCTVRVLKGNTQTHLQNDAIGDDDLTIGYRSMTISTSGAGEYTARITCSDPAGTEKGWKEFSFRRYN